MPDDATPVAQLRNIGPTTAAWLNAIGIHTRADLVSVGPVDAYVVLTAEGYNTSLNLLYAIEGALRDIPWNRLPDRVQKGLRERVKPE